MSKQSLIVTTVIIVVLVVGLGLLAKSRTSPVTNTTPSLTPGGYIQEQEKVEELEDKMPQGTPDFPFYPGAIVTKSYKKDFSDHQEFLVYWEVEDTVPEIVAWYIQTFHDSGWQVSQTSENLQAADEQILKIENDNYQVVLIVNNEEESGVSWISAEFKPL